MPAPSRRTAFTKFAALILTAAMALAALPSAAAGADGDIGIQGPGHPSLGGSPTGTKPESKLWFNDGIWWATMFSEAHGDHRIHRLNRSTGTWVDAGTTVDTRNSSRADALWDAASGKLYIASHSYTSTSSSTATGTNGKLWRFSYDAATDRYTRDSGFPASIGSGKSETLVIDKDSTGRLWATWMGGNRVWVNRTTTGDAAWGTPYAIPGTSSADADDISSVIAFDGRIGVLWSDQVKDVWWFAVHADGASDAAWSVEAVDPGWTSDDHVNVKADSQGNLYAAVKTSETSSSRPLVLMLKRTASTGAWSTTVFGLDADSHTRPILLLDEGNDRVHMLATCPQPPSTSGQSGGDICEKVSSMSNPSFPTGIGTPIIRDLGSDDMNDATSTKQRLSTATGIVVMADNKTTRYYWHSDRPLGTATAVSADFTATPTSGTAPLEVRFTDSSTGSPTSWAWSFGDGATSTAQHPTHVYSDPGTYSVSLTVSRSSDGATHTVTKSGYVTVAAPPTEPTGTLALSPVADAHVRSESPTRNYGSETVLRVRQGTVSNPVTYRAYLKFDVRGLTGPVSGAKLRLYVTDSSPDGGSVFRVGDAWTESGITWNTAPALPTTAVAALGSVTAGTWAQVDLGSQITGDGVYSFAVSTTSANSSYYSSREGANAPQLVLPSSS